ncbi:MAG: hypothetical protein ACOC1F_07440 [Myxococcota bacterium]
MASLFAMILSAFATGCAGGAPLMHPAHTLPEGHVRFAGGASANFVVGDAADAIDEAEAAPVGGFTDRPSESYARGALAAAAMSPGVSPLVAARVGLGYDAEGGLSYAGRSVRIDGRYALQNESVALSAGVGGSALLSRRGPSPDAQVAGLNLEATTGWGVDVPIVFGWQSEGDIVWWWTGARGGYEELRGQVGYEGPEPAVPIDGDIDGRRVYVLGLMGLAVGFRHLHAAVEVHGGYQQAEGTLWDNDVDVSGASVSPAAALIGKF